MNITHIIKSHATQDGAGVNIKRIAGFSDPLLDPFLMIDQLKSTHSRDFIAGFPAHPHRGIETFTYMLSGAFEHQDQLGNKKAITAGNVQWMSTGRGVVHSEMPIADPIDGMHGFQIWLNMPAQHKMRVPQYQDSTDHPLAQIEVHDGVHFKALAGQWFIEGQDICSTITGLSAQAAIADVSMQANTSLSLELKEYETVLVFIHSGALSQYSAGHCLVVDSQQPITLETDSENAGILILTGKKIKEPIAHMGPFVMNTQAELIQAVRDYQSGQFGEIV